MSKVESENIKLVNHGVLEPEKRMKAIYEFGNAVEIDINIPPRRYYRSGLEMVRMANVYLEEGDLENAFILYMKFMTLFLEKVREHPEYNSVPALDKAKNKEKLREVLPKAESLKHRLLIQYKKEYDRYLADKELRNMKTAQGRWSMSASLTYDLKLKKREEQERKKQQELREEIQKLKELSRTQILNPSIPLPVITQVPPLPDDLGYSSDYVGLPKVKPDDLPLNSGGSQIKPGVDRTTKPSSLLSPSIHNTLRLRTIVIPSKLEVQFLALSQRNTEKNIETCGILAGKLNHDQFVITHLIVPKQHGSPDSCSMENEEQICEYSDNRELLTLGWIHTHPTQSAFLSSVDLHTHFSYQLMMPEAIAVVCAPKYKDTKVFCLTPHYGLDFIKNCHKVGFHPHPNDPPLFMIAEHVKYEPSAHTEIADFRR